MTDDTTECYVLGPDIDLDAEDVRRPDGTRLSEHAAQQLASEAITTGRRGRPAVDPDVSPGERSPRVTFRVPAQTRRQLEQRARDQGRPVADVLREAVERYLR
ncbi:MAG: ribbon-helix-helix protein, CopG family [Pseudonocardiaceae bacterium]